MSIRTNKYNNPFCTNCGNQGHSSKQCSEPVTSYGIILFRIKDDWNQGAVICKPCVTSLEDIYNEIEYLMIRRKDTLGFIELMRGKYNIADREYLKKHISSMTLEEQERIKNLSFKDLWEGLWGKPVEGGNTYKHEKEVSREKLESIRESGLLNELIKEVGSYYEEAEWGFPKGRRDLFENDYTCAAREVYEETGIKDDEYFLINNMEPIVESFIGSNNINYCHKYFMGFMPTLKETVHPNSTEIMKREIGKIEWMSLTTALQKIRPYNSEKRSVLSQIALILRNYCPLFLPTEIDEYRRSRRDGKSRIVECMGYRKK
jgi:8-oxo-dGTP pyrophosphatase MutT (NUDIX family)